MLKLHFVYQDPNADLGWMSNGCPLVYRCREQFHTSFRNNFTMIFRGSIAKARRLFSRIEDKVGVQAKNRVRFQETSSARWMQVTPNWWIEDSMRFSLFTVLLRASRSHTTIKGAMKYPQMKSTQDAFTKFLDGGVNFIGGGVSGWNGWRNRMCYKRSGADYLVSSEERTKIDKLKKVKKVREIVKHIQRIGSSATAEEALIHCLSKNGCF